MVVAWVGSGFLRFSWFHKASKPYFDMYGHRGTIAGNFGVGNEPLQINVYPSAWPNSFWWGKEPRYYASNVQWNWTPMIRTDPDSSLFVVLPLWLPTLVFAVPAAWMWRVDVKRRRAVREGCCAKCGYSLVGTPADKPCPEYGTARA